MLSRREFLIGLAAVVPATSVLIASRVMAEGEDALLIASRVIVGRNDLDPAIAKRIRTALSGRVDGFEQKVKGLAAALSTGQDRDAALAALSSDQLDLALQIARPWYTGVAGVPDDTGFDDNAHFITYLGAQAMLMGSKHVPFPSYSRDAPGWWAEPPAGVQAPAMPPQVRDWTFVPAGADGPVAPADPQFLALVTPPGVPVPDPDRSAPRSSGDTDADEALSTQ